MSKTPTAPAMAPRKIYNCLPRLVIFGGVPLKPGADGNEIPFDVYARIKPIQAFQDAVRAGHLRADKHVAITAIRPNAIGPIDLGAPKPGQAPSRRRANRPLVSSGASDLGLLSEVTATPQDIQAEIERAQARLAQLEALAKRSGGPVEAKPAADEGKKSAEAPKPAADEGKKAAEAPKPAADEPRKASDKADKAKK